MKGLPKRESAKDRYKRDEAWAKEYMGWMDSQGAWNGMPDDVYQDYQKAKDILKPGQSRYGQNKYGRNDPKQDALTKAYPDPNNALVRWAESVDPRLVSFVQLPWGERNARVIGADGSMRDAPVTDMNAAKRKWDELVAYSRKTGDWSIVKGAYDKVAQSRLQEGDDAPSTGYGEPLNHKGAAFGYKAPKPGDAQPIADSAYGAQAYQPTRGINEPAPPAPQAHTPEEPGFSKPASFDNFTWPQAKQDMQRELEWLEMEAKRRALQSRMSDPYGFDVRGLIGGGK